MSPVEWITFGLAICVMLVGVLGTVVPLLPGLPIIWLSMLVYAIVEGFETVDSTFLALALCVVIAAEAADYYGRAWGARKFGASKRGAMGAVVGSIVGLFFLPLGLIMGPFLGAFLAELLAGRDTSESMRAGLGGLIGTLGSMAVKFVVAIGMTIFFVVTVL